MFKFRSAQKVIKISDVEIGGNPGEKPPVLIGTIFYHGHMIVSDEKKGEFNKNEAEKLIKVVEEVSEITKIPTMIDVTGSSPEAIVRYLDFVIDVTKLPIFVDAPSIDVMKASFDYIKSSGLSDRVTYNSLTAKSKDEEYKILKDSRIKNAVALLYTDKILDVNARLNALNIIIRKVSVFGIENVLVDTFVMDVPSLAVAMRTALVVKSQFGYPCGCGAHNAISAQRKAFKERFGKDGVNASELAVNIAPIVIGLDFLLYGPIEKAREVFPAVYTIFTSYKYLLKTKSTLVELYAHKDMLNLD